MKVRRVTGWVLLLLLAASPAAWGGPNAGGTIFVHNAGLAYPGGHGFSACGLGTPPASCSAANVNLSGSDADHPRVWKVYAAFLDGSSPRLKGVSFGIQYDSNISITDHGNCCGDQNNGAAEVPGAGWPGSGTGTSLVFQSPQTSTLVE